ncbi:hypothetical protein BJ322DRAFT_1033345 [Thelephora terrestris]|uniref:Vacuolar sorting protein Vps3844 C-terminal domain-containing protein n=1 Tax=Thelephora terrestris TaxID=56493 RepID=A0A9P6HRM1_9AGAM|nr:hypothetical protein BJ322DRAFT_1033345 [Thelephora terrestris]
MKGLLVCLLLPVGLAQAVRVYLSPSPSLPSRLSAKQASFALSRHLDLESFETLDENSVIWDTPTHQEFIGQGPKDGLLLTIDESYSHDVIPKKLKPTFEIPSPSSVTSLYSLVSTFLRRAPSTYSQILSEASYPAHGVPRLLDIFSVPSTATGTFMSEISTLLDFVESDSTSGKFGAFELRGLTEIQRAYGSGSEQYRVAADSLRAVIQSATAKGSINLAVLVHTPNSREKREPQQTPLPSPLPNQPISSTSTCYDSQETCQDETSSCSGHGGCAEVSKAGKTCFVCACSATKDSKGRTENWAGEACERMDVSGPFVLLAGTTIGLLIIIVGSIGLLYKVGDAALPSTLTGGVGGLKRD